MELYHPRQMLIYYLSSLSEPDALAIDTNQISPEDGCLIEIRNG